MKAGREHRVPLSHRALSILRTLEAAALYGISRSTIYVLMAQGKLRTVKIAGRRLVPRDAIEALIAGDAT
jgi:excisionase family DNA binding protein